MMMKMKISLGWSCNISKIIIINFLFCLAPYYPHILRLLTHLLQMVLVAFWLPESLSSWVPDVNPTASSQLSYGSGFCTKFLIVDEKFSWLVWLDIVPVRLVKYVNEERYRDFITCFCMSPLLVLPPFSFLFSLCSLTTTLHWKQTFQALVMMHFTACRLNFGW